VQFLADMCVSQRVCDWLRQAGVVRADSIRPKGNAAGEGHVEGVILPWLKGVSMIASAERPIPLEPPRPR